MNDLSQNELLSAYLDGELSAAEQAEVERLLAARPAARQLLDDLRALSATLQSLPQEKLDEDLSQRVLRAAERRMLTEGNPEISPFTPVPLVRSVFQRFVNRRTLAWLGLTAAIAAAIWINEGRQPGPGVAKADREVARTLEKPAASAAKPAAEPALPPSMQATGEGAFDSLKMRDRSGSGKPFTPPAPAAGAPPPVRPAGKLGVENGEKLAGQTGGDEGLPRLRKATAPAAPAESNGPGAAPSAMAAGGLGGQGPALEAAKDEAAEAGRLKKRDADLGHDAGKGPRAFATGPAAAKTGAANKALPAGPPVLLVHCDIAPAALQKKAFDKLLDANGIIGHRQPQRRGPVDDAEIAGRQSDNNREMKEKQATKGGVSAIPEGEAADLIYVEATPAQVKAVLAGLAAQPEVFVAVSAEPVQGRQAEEIVHQYRYAGRGQAQLKSAFGGGRGFQGKDNSRGLTAPGEGPGRPAMPAESETTPRDGQNAGQAAGAAAAPSPASGGGERRQAGPVPKAQAMERSEAEAAAEATKPEASQQQQPEQSAPPQRVLFVLRVAAGRPPIAPKDSAKAEHE